MEESYIEGLATHGGPDHASAPVRVTAKRWTGARAGRAIEPRNHLIRGADDVYEIGRPHRQQRYRELLVDPARSENHCMHGTSLRENREVSCLPVWLITGRAAQGRLRRWLASVVRGHLAYYAVPGNIDAISAFRDEVRRLWLQALRHRSQRTRLTWERMGRLSTRWLPPARFR